MLGWHFPPLKGPSSSKMQAFLPHTLYVVGTPIGNLDELTPRAAEALRAAHTIYAEDTRVTKKLLTYLGTSAELKRADEHELVSIIPKILAQLQDSSDIVCYASDAGMPAISDPGQPLIDAARKNGLAVEVISGPVAAITALVSSGLWGKCFTFLGFLPRKPAAQKALLQRSLAQGRTFVFYESPHRVQKTVLMLASLAPGVRVAFARELTKLHEEVLRAPAQKLAEMLAEKPSIKGECVIVVEGRDALRDGFAKEETTSTSVVLGAGSCKDAVIPAGEYAPAPAASSAPAAASPVAAPSAPAAASPAASSAPIDALCRALVQEGIAPSKAAKIVKKACNVSREEAYQKLLAYKENYE